MSVMKYFNAIAALHSRIDQPIDGANAMSESSPCFLSAWPASIGNKTTPGGSKMKLMNRGTQFM